MAADGVIAPDDRRDPAQHRANDRAGAHKRHQNQHDGPCRAGVKNAQRPEQECQDRGGGAGFLA